MRVSVGGASVGGGERRKPTRRGEFRRDEVSEWTSVVGASVGVDECRRGRVSEWTSVGGGECRDSCEIRVLGLWSETRMDVVYWF